MHVVGHQAIGPHIHVFLTRMLCQKITVDLLVAVFEEDGFATVAALCHVMWQAVNSHTGETSHGKR
jgi:hypothetical protein